MNLKAILFSVFSLFVISGLHAQFEGTITMNSSVAADFNAVFTVKGDQVLMETEADGKSIRMISEKESGDVIILTESEGKKIAVKLNPTAMQQGGMPGMQKQKVEKADNTRLTNERKKINGYDCVKVVGEDEASNYEAWITNDLNFSIFDLFPMLKDTRDYSAETDIVEAIFEKGFILEMTETKKKTDEVSKMTATINEQKVNASLFNISEEEYQVFDLTDMAKLMQEASTDPEKMQQLQKIFEEMSNN